jgi:hypothetical protein
VELALVSVVVPAVDVESVGGAVSVDVELLSVLPEMADTIPKAPEASIPAQSKAPNPRTIPARRSDFRPFISPAPPLPRYMRRMNDPLSSFSGGVPGGRGGPDWRTQLLSVRQFHVPLALPLRRRNFRKFRNAAMPQFRSCCDGRGE